MVTVSLPIERKYLADWLKWRYPPDKEGRLALRCDLLGAIIIAHVRSSSFSVPTPSGVDIVTFLLPVGLATQPLEKGWAYLTEASKLSVNRAIRAVFEIDFTAYYLKGRERGIAKKDIVEAYMISRRLISTDCFDALHKRAYRKEQRAMGALTKAFMRKAKYVDESIDYSGLEI